MPRSPRDGAGQAAVFAPEEFFFGSIRNAHTRAAYLIAVRRFLNGLKPGAWSFMQMARRRMWGYI